MLIVVEVNVGAEFLPDGLLDKVCEEILKYLEQSEFSHYNGYLGVDTYICRTGPGEFRLRPSVEINLRMTMGIVAARVYQFFSERFEDGKYLMETVFAPSYEELMEKLKLASEILTDVNESSRYAIIVRPR